MTLQETEQQETDSANWKRVIYIGKTVQYIRIVPPKLPVTGASKEFYPWIDANLPEDKEGIEIFWKGLERPTKTFPYKDTVEQVDDMKKLIMSSIRSFAAMFKNNPVKTLFMLVFFRKEIENTALDMLAEFHVRLREVRNKDTTYSRAVREVLRTFDATKSDERVRDIMCMVMEYDDAYRYRFQDIIGYLKKENLDNPIKEIERLLDILADKEGEETVMKPKWQKMKKMLIILRFKKELREKVKAFLIELNLDEMKLDVADQYHSSKKPNFWWNYLKERPLPK